MLLIVILTIVSGITGLLSGVIGAGPEVLIVPLLTYFGTTNQSNIELGRLYLCYYQ